jgi:hypothetical protein
LHTVLHVVRLVTFGGNLVSFSAARRLPNFKYQGFIKVRSVELRSV